MNLLKYSTTIATLTCLLLPAACDDSNSNQSTGVSAELLELCNSTCNKGKTLDCPAESNVPVSSCIEECKGIAQSRPKCQTQFQTYLTCADDQPMSNWTCDAEQESNVMPGLCDNEYDAMEACVSSNASD